MVTESSASPRDLPRALFVCVRGAGRSVMAAALWQAVGGAARARGWRPADAVYPEAVEALTEVGLTSRLSVPRKISPEDLRWAELVIRIDCPSEAELPPGIRALDWSLPQSSGQGIEGMRALRDAIRERIEVEGVDDPGLDGAENLGRRTSRSPSAHALWRDP